MPFDASLLRCGYHYVPHQMPKIDRALRGVRRVEDESCSAVPGKMRVEVLLHNPDDRYRCFAARGLRILDHLAEHNCPSDIQNLVLSVVVIPPQPFQFL